LVAAAGEQFPDIACSIAEPIGEELKGSAGPAKQIAKQSFHVLLNSLGGCTE
jgi:hypothetical protein